MYTGLSVMVCYLLSLFCLEIDAYKSMPPVLLYMAVTIEQLLLSVGAALVYSVVFYAKNYAGDEPEKFEWKKFTATLIVGLIIGIASGLAGIDVTQQFIYEQLAMYAGTIALVETIIKAIYKELKKGSPKDPQSMSM